MSYAGPSLIGFNTFGTGIQANLISTGYLQLYGPNSVSKGVVQNNAGATLLLLDTVNMNIDVGGNIVPLGSTQNLGSATNPFQTLYINSLNISGLAPNLVIQTGPSGTIITSNTIAAPTLTGTVTVSALANTYVYANGSGQLVADPGNIYLPLTGGTLTGALTVTTIFDTALANHYVYCNGTGKFVVDPGGIYFPVAGGTIYGNVIISGNLTLNSLTSTYAYLNGSGQFVTDPGGIYFPTTGGYISGSVTIAGNLTIDTTLYASTISSSVTGNVTISAPLIIGSSTTFSGLTGPGYLYITGAGLLEVDPGGTYLPLSGGTMTGSILASGTIAIGSSGTPFNQIFGTALFSNSYSNLAGSSSLAWSASLTAWQLGGLFLPSATNTYGLGSASYTWNSLNVGTITSTSITATGTLTNTGTTVLNYTTSTSSVNALTINPVFSGSLSNGILVNMTGTGLTQTGYEVLWNNAQTPNAGFFFQNISSNFTCKGLVLGCTAAAGNSAGSQITLQASNGSGGIVSGNMVFAAATVPLLAINFTISATVNAAIQYGHQLLFTSSNANAIAMNIGSYGSGTGQTMYEAYWSTTVAPKALFNADNASYNGTIVGLNIAAPSMSSAGSQISMNAYNTSTSSVTTCTLVYAAGAIPTLTINQPTTVNGTVTAINTSGTSSANSLYVGSTLGSSAITVAVQVGGSAASQVGVNVYWTGATAPAAAYQYQNTIVNSTTIGLNLGITSAAGTSAGSQLNMQAWNTTSSAINTCSLVYAAGTAPQLTINNNFAPATTSTYNLGSSSLLWHNVYSANMNTTTIYSNTAYTGSVGSTSPFLSVVATNWVTQFFDGVNTRQNSLQNTTYGASYALAFQTTGSFGANAYRFDNQVIPYADNSYPCGNGSQRWSVIYAATSTINTSDSRMKSNIVPSALGLNFVNQLKPVSYTRKDAHNGRTHYGLLAQDVQTTLTAMNLTSKDFAGFVYSKREDGATITLDDGTSLDDYYGLRYEEFIAPLIAAVQQLSAVVTVLQAQVNGLATPH